jgi:SagB-type dehydrogenase family enzyme
MDTTFRASHPVAWLFHRNTSRWLHNSLDGGLDGADVPQAPKEHPLTPFVPLPDRGVPTGFEDLLLRRNSCRRFDDGSIGLPRLGRVLSAGYGVSGHSRLGALEFLDRPVPSGGGLYPLEVYVIARAVDGLTPGVYHYAPVLAGLEQLREVDIPARLLTYLFMGQSLAAEAACVVVLTAVVSRSLGKYGDRGYRYLMFEAGHVAQNTNLAAIDQGLGACNLGGFFDDELAALLTVDIDLEIPLYATALGVPASHRRDEQRAFEEEPHPPGPST